MATFSESPTTIDEAARRDFEAAWKAQTPRPIEDFLPRPDQAHFLPTLEELIAIDLEMAWRRQQAGGPPAGLLEQYIARFPCLKDNAEALLRLMRQEFRVRHRYGDKPSTSQYVERFPALDSQQTEILAGLAQVKAAPAPPPTARAGENLGRYRLCAEHGKGGFGLVWRAIDEALGREVAVKQLGARLVQDANLRARFLTEARIAAQLQHPGVVPVYDVGGAEQNSPYYTMKLVAGQTLAEAIRRFHDEALPPGQAAVEYLRLLNAYLSVVRTMAFAHSRHVIHRDLKPQNIILGEYGETIILDWGLAKVLKEAADTVTPVPTAAASDSPDLTQPGAVMGTPAYMAPEQATGDIQRVDQRSDVFALGAILYHLLTGKRPFEGTSSETVLKAVVEQQPARPRALKASLPRPLEAICLKAMAKDPAQRYADAAELTQDVELYLADEPVSAYAEPWTTRLGRWARRRRRTLAVGFSLLALAAVILVAWLQIERVGAERDQEAATRLADAQRTAVEARELAKKRLRDGAFGDAARILQGAVANLKRWPDLAALRDELAQAEDRATRLDAFYRFQRLASRHYYYERDDQALSDMKNALNQFGALEKEPWEDHLPTADLTEEQSAQLREDVHGGMLLYGGFIAKPALQNFPFIDGKGCKEALAICRRAQRYKPTQGGTLVELFCRYATGDFKGDEGKNALRDIKITSPQTPTDFLIMGIGHTFIVEDQTGLTEALIDGLNVPGVHAKEAKRYAHTYLTQATRLDPRRFWAYIWLGRYLKEQKNLVAAGLAFQACVTAEPDDADGYIHRGENLILEGRGAKEPERSELWKRGRADVDRAYRLAPRDPAVRLRRYQSLAWMAEGDARLVDDALDEALAWMDLERSGLWLDRFVNKIIFVKHWGWVEEHAVNLEKAGIRSARLDVVLARVRLALGNRDDAFRRAQAILRDDPRNPHALAVAGEVRLHKALADKKKPNAGLLAQARENLEDAWRQRPGHFQTGANLAHVLQREVKPREELKIWQTLLEQRDRLAVWQEVEALLASARLHADLGEPDQARAALALARPHSLLAVESLEPTLKLR